MKTTLPEFITAASGRLGDRVFLYRDGRTISRRFVPPSDPKTPDQRLARARFAQAVRAWGALTDAQRHAWEDYGATRVRTESLWAETKTQNGYGAFLTLSLKRLHLLPGAALPVLPPDTAFSGDTATVTARAGTGEIIWRASRPNTAGVVTELLAQQTRGRTRQPSLEKYRALAFVSFTHERMATVTPRTPGTWACAVRFLCTETGQTTEMVRLPPVEVGL